MKLTKQDKNTKSNTPKKDNLYELFEAILALDSKDKSVASEIKDKENLNELFRDVNDKGTPDTSEEVLNNSSGSKQGILHKFSMVDVVTFFKEIIKKKDVLSINHRQQKRMKRSENYEQEIYFAIICKTS